MTPTSLLIVLFCYLITLTPSSGEINSCVRGRLLLLSSIFDSVSFIAIDGQSRLADRSERQQSTFTCLTLRTTNSSFLKLRAIEPLIAIPTSNCLVHRHYRRRFTFYGLGDEVEVVPLLWKTGVSLFKIAVFQTLYARLQY